jgi:hypothetical protein
MTIKIKTFIQATLLLIFIFVCSSIAFSQSKNTSPGKIYLQGAVGAASNKGFFSDLGVQAILKNKWVTTLSYHSIDMEPKNLPGDYNPGYTMIIFIPIPNKTPSSDLKVLSFTAGKYYKTGRKTWFTTEAGLSLVSGKEMKFSKSSASSWTIIFVGEQPPNYTQTEEKKTTMGAMLKADFNWAFASFAGLGGGVFGNFNSIQSPIGFQIKLIVGKMNRGKKLN